MPRFNEVINNFINGEVSPKLYGRTDSEVYKRSCRTLKNMIVHPQGGASRRVGTQRLAEALPDAELSTMTLHAIVDGARVVPYVFDENEKYIIVFNKVQDSNGDNLIHYYRVDTDIWSAQDPNEASALQPTGTITVARGTLNNSSFSASDKLQDSTVLAEMQYTQAGSYMVFVHESFPPFVITRLSEGNLGWGDYHLQYQSKLATDFGPIPFCIQNLTDITITASAVTVGAGRTLTASDPFFNAGHVGAQFCFEDGGTVGYGVVTAVGSTTSATFQIVDALPAGAASGTKLWYEAAWSDYKGWPRTVAFWNSALYFGGSPTFPERVWKSQDFDIFEMANPATQNSGATIKASDPYFNDLAVGSNGISRINWLAPGGKDLLVGTTFGEVAISSWNVDTVGAKPQTSEGAEPVQPVIVDGVPHYVQRGHRKIREIIFDDRIQGYQSPDITLLAEHMPRLGQREISGTVVAPKIKQMAYQNLDNSIVWFIDNNGFLFGCTKERTGNVVAFHRHDVGGKVSSICALPSRDGTFDELYMIVGRTVNSLTEYYLERLSNEFYGATLNSGQDERSRLPLFSDSGMIFQRPDTPNFWAQLKDGVDADIAGGTATGTATGTVTYEFDKAKFDGSTYISYDGTSNADVAQVGCIRWWSHTTTFATNAYMFAISQSNASTNNLIAVRNNNGAIHVTINDSTGAAIINDALFGTTGGYGLKLFELNYDLTAGATRLFINGVQLGSTNTSTGTRNTTIDNIVIGANYNGNTEFTGYIYDFNIFDTVQHTAGYEMLDFLPLGVKLYKLDDLEGETVQVTADGNYVGDFVVSGGEIADIGADYTASSIIAVGLPYTSTLEIQPVDIGSGIGSSVGAVKRIDRAVVRFRESATGSVGESTSNLDTLIFRDDATALTDPIVLVTDDKYMEFPGGYNRTARAVVQTSDPLPMNVTCLSLRGITGDV